MPRNSNGRFSRTHGHGKDPMRPGKATLTYFCWRSMKARCLNPAHKAYPDYGGRGIAVCERWMSFENFLTDMGEKPEGLSLNRINNDGSYSPENCKWATPSEQQNNKRTNRVIEFDGKRMTITEWSRHIGVSYAALYQRLKRYSIELALLPKLPSRSSNKGEFHA